MIKSNRVSLFRYVLVVVVVFVALSTALPATASASGLERCRNRTTFLSFPVWYEYLDVSSDCTVSAITYPAGDPAAGRVNIGATVGAVLLAVIEILLRVAGLVAVGFVIYGGILYTISQGVPEKLNQARTTLLNGVIGLVIASLSVALVALVANLLT